MKSIKGKSMNKNLLLILHLTLIFIVFACNEDELKKPIASTQAKFTIEIENNGIAPAKVYFINQSVNATSYLWKFAILIGISTAIINEGIKVSRPEP